jgi:hypothetical protein
MAIPTPALFKTATMPPKTTVGIISFSTKSYGGNLVKVLAALEAYDDNKASPQLAIKEALLYNLWKQCNKWLTLKLAKEGGTKTLSTLYVTRKTEVNDLKNEAINELTAISPRASQALQTYDIRKRYMGAHNNLKSLGSGYNIEREIYLTSNKSTGAVLSGTIVHGQLENRANMSGQGQKNFKKVMGKKTFDTMSMAQAQRLEKVFEGAQETHVSYLNKIARLQYIVTPDINGLLCDLNDNLIAMNLQGMDNNYYLCPYVMDKYGNLFIYNKAATGRGVAVVTNTGGNTFQYANNQYVWNHSSFLAGADVLCAGCLHIGYSVTTAAAAPGVLTAIDNSSGHYKPTRDHLRRCLLQLEADGIDVDQVRVGVMGPTGVSFYWGAVFKLTPMAIPAWTDSTAAPLNAPPVQNTMG